MQPLFSLGISSVDAKFGNVVAPWLQNAHFQVWVVYQNHRLRNLMLQIQLYTNIERTG